MKYTRRIIRILFREFHLLYVNPKIFIIRWVHCFMLNSILGIKKDFYYRYRDNIRIRFPNRIGVSYILMETFVYKIFERMTGLKRVLDIGGFIGESAIYLSDRNKEVFCYELSEINFAYLKENCQQSNNVRYYHAGVTDTDKEYIEYSETSSADSTVRVGGKSSKKILKAKNINILKILKKMSFDGLKLDIEGGEYIILNSLIDNEIFTFKKGIIEFHDLDEDEKICFLKKFIDYLGDKNYVHSIFTNEKQQIKISDLHHFKFCNLYFELRN